MSRPWNSGAGRRRANLAHLAGPGYIRVMATTNRRRLSAIFFSDMKGFSRAMDEDEDATLDLLRDHNQIMDEQVAAHNGRVVKTVGDAYMVEFESSVDAVAGRDPSAAARPGGMSEPVQPETPRGNGTVLPGSSDADRGHRAEAKHPVLGSR